MAAGGVLVFDDDQAVITEGGGSQPSFVVREGSQDLLVFDPDVRPVVQDDPSTDGEVDFILVSTQELVTQIVQLPPDLMLVDAPKQPTRAVLDTDPDQDLVVVTAGGPPGEQGPKGDKGDQGDPGLAGPGAYYAEFNFATPLSTWTVVHNQNSYAVNVETVDTNGEVIEGYVRFVDLNTVEIDWYYPTAGAARLFR